jgi:hypothetical protein
LLRLTTSGHCGLEIPLGEVGTAHRQRLERRQARVEGGVVDALRMQLLVDVRIQSHF